MSTMAIEASTYATARKPEAKLLSGINRLVIKLVPISDAANELIDRECDTIRKGLNRYPGATGTCPRENSSGSSRVDSVEAISSSFR